MRYKLCILFSFLFVFAGMTKSFGEECVDPSQLQGGTLAGFGEYDDSNDKEGVRYRGQTFVAENESLGGITFKMYENGSTDLRVRVCKLAEDGLTPGEEVYFWDIPHSEIEMVKKRYELPQTLSLSVGEKYVFYFAPYKNGEYQDDYRDMIWSLGDPYSEGKGVVNINGEWIF